MKRILVTGTTGNIGVEVVHHLYALKSDAEIYLAVRNIGRAKEVFKDKPDLRFRIFDFENAKTYCDALNQIDIVFLLRPPQISEVERVFKPLLSSAKDNGIRQVVFLSVQGAERNKMIPHNKIETRIKSLKFNFIFVRSSYFMQNLTTILHDEIVTKKCITVPSGKAKFNWIDVKNIGEATAHLILHFKRYENQAFEITGTENKDFSEVVRLMTEVTKEQIQFKSINPISFYSRKKKEGMTSGFAGVMTLLHFLPRFQDEPVISDNYHKLTGKKKTLKRNNKSTILPMCKSMFSVSIKNIGRS